jgi:hypothetical protein
MAQRDAECVRNPKEVIETWGLDRELHPHDGHTGQPGKLRQALLA